NPTATTAVPVVRVGATTGTPAPVYYATVRLAVEVVPGMASQNPAGTQVTFHLRNQAAQLDLVRYARADSWGAAFVEVLLDDQHLQGRFTYSASAAGFGATPLRSFGFDTSRYSSDIRLGAARTTTRVEPDGRLIVDVESDRPIDDQASAVEITTVRLIPTTA